MKRFKRELNITIREYINIKKILNSLEHYNYDNKILNIDNFLTGNSFGF